MCSSRFAALLDAEERGGAAAGDRDRDVAVAVLVEDQLARRSRRRMCGLRRRSSGSRARRARRACRGRSPAASRWSRVRLSAMFPKRSTPSTVARIRAWPISGCGSVEPDERVRVDRRAELAERRRRARGARPRARRGRDRGTSARRTRARTAGSRARAHRRRRRSARRREAAARCRGRRRSGLRRREARAAGAPLPTPGSTTARCTPAGMYGSVFASIERALQHAAGTDAVRDVDDLRVGRDPLRSRRGTCRRSRPARPKSVRNVMNDPVESDCTASSRPSRSCDAATAATSSPCSRASASVCGPIATTGRRAPVAASARAADGDATTATSPSGAGGRSSTVR